MNGIIIRSLGGSYTVEAPEGVYECAARGIFRKKGISPVCGDKVEISFEKDGAAVIDKIYDRRSFIVRPQLANLDVLVLVSSTVDTIPQVRGARSLQRHFPASFALLREIPASVNPRF